MPANEYQAWMLYSLATLLMRLANCFLNQTSQLRMTTDKGVSGTIVPPAMRMALSWREVIDKRINHGSASYAVVWNSSNEPSDASQLRYLGRHNR
ncbi:hypothetical protein B0I35DRAFT_423843 [Stachybotrys elegans]|uniref:Uncharacterized protein n=1 Tax=Stachybotrys elegans TaxID=80388 RepID=A0A8K0WTI4_9HYPO|nr:hypothetical protein B0I35DRAFT_423843 [Stachybotrys elegans]